jgi:hypothetical protein
VTTGETVAAPTGERSVSGPRFPIGLRGATTAYVASANIDAAMRGVGPGHHVSAVRDPSVSADDESSHSSASELPPATSHGYAEWDFSGVPDPVIVRRFLDATDYWFGYSDNSSAESYDPARECFVVLANDQANATNEAEADDGEVPPPRPGNRTAPECGAKRPSLLTARGPTSTRSWLKRVSLKPSSQRSTARCGCFEPPSLGKPPLAANARVSQASKPASASTPTSTSTTRTHPVSEPEAHRRCDTAAGHARPHNTRGAEPAPRGAGANRASGRSAGRKLGVTHPSAGERAGRRGRARPRTIGTRGRRSGMPRQPRAHAGQGAEPRHARASPRWPHSQCHQRPADGQREDTGDGRLPPLAGWAL